MEDTKTCLEKQPLSQEMLEKMNAYWRAANYLSAGQLYHGTAHADNSCILNLLDDFFL